MFQESVIEICLGMNRIPALKRTILNLVTHKVFIGVTLGVLLSWFLNLELDRNLPGS